MKVYKEIDLVNFEFWSGAVENAKEFTIEELEEIQAILEDDELFNVVHSETEINDLFWFDSDVLHEWVGHEYNEDTDEWERVNN